MGEEKRRIFFLGTPEFAVPVLTALAESGRYDIAAVITQPDKPAGRGAKLTAPPVKQAALSLTLPLLQPNTLRGLNLVTEGESKFLTGGEDSLRDILGSGSFDIGIAVAYGKIIPPSLLNLPRAGIVNVHPSLLPRWRGAAPLQWSIFAGDKTTGVSIMKLDEGLDTGPVYLAREVPIDRADTFGTLHDKLSKLGSELILECLPEILSGELLAKAQPAEGATYAEKWEAEDLQINWQERAAITERRIRASIPEYGGRTTLEGEPVKIHLAHEITDGTIPELEPGIIAEVNKKELIVSCGFGSLIAVDEVQFPGKRKIAVREALLGRNIKAGMRFL